MDSLFNFIGTASPTSGILAILLIAAAFYIYHVSFPLQESTKALEEKNKALEKECADLQAIIKKHVEHSQAEKLVLEILETCQATHELVVGLAKSTDGDFKELEVHVNKLLDIIKDISKDGSSRKLDGLDAEMRLITNQLAVVSSRLSGIMGMLMGSSSGPNNRNLMSDMMNDDLRDLK